MDWTNIILVLAWIINIFQGTIDKPRPQICDTSDNIVLPTSNAVISLSDEAQTESELELELEPELEAEAEAEADSISIWPVIYTLDFQQWFGTAIGIPEQTVIRLLLLLPGSSNEPPMTELSVHVEKISLLSYLYSWLINAHAIKFMCLAELCAVIYGSSRITAGFCTWLRRRAKPKIDLVPSQNQSVSGGIEMTVTFDLVNGGRYFVSCQLVSDEVCEDEDEQSSSCSSSEDSAKTRSLEDTIDSVIEVTTTISLETMKK